MYFVVELNNDESMVKLDDLKNEVQNKAQEIIDLIHRIKDKGMSREDKNRLDEIIKKPLVLLMKLKTKERNAAYETLKVTTFKDSHFIYAYACSISCITLAF